MTKTFIYILFLLTSFTGFTQKVEVKSYVNKNDVVQNEIFTFEITTNAKCQIYRPEFGQLQVLQGPFQSNSSRSVVVNGQITMKSELKITYKLRAPKKGNYTIKPVKLICDGKTYETKKITVKVKEGSSNSKNQNTSSNGNSDFFVKMHTNKNNIYQGEPFVISLKMYSKNQPQNLENIEFGDSKGIWRKDLNPKKTNFNSEMEIINGIRYFTTSIHTELCFAQTSGEITISPGYISAIFRQGFFQSYRREAHSNTLKINVKPLPKNAPKNFNGLVGSFELSHEISRTSLKPGEAIDLKISISGKGNMNAFDDPKLDIPNDFEQFDPEVKNSLNYKSSGINGSITYNYVLVPTFYGDYAIPSYRFSYFDTESKSYKTLSTGDFNIHVEKTKNSKAGHQNLSQNKKEVDVQNEDIHYLITDDQSVFKYSDFLISKPYYLLLLALPFLTLVAIFYRRKKMGTDSHQKTLAIKAMKKKTSKLLDEAKSFHQNNNDQEALKALSNSFKSYIKQKLDITTHEMSLKQIQNKLQGNRIESQQIDQFTDIWNTIEMYQYSPISANKIDELISNAEQLIQHLDQNL